MVGGGALSRVLKEALTEDDGEGTFHTSRQKYIKTPGLFRVTRRKTHCAKLELAKKCCGVEPAPVSQMDDRNRADLRDQTFNVHTRKSSNVQVSFT